MKANYIYEIYIIDTGHKYYMNRRPLKNQIKEIIIKDLGENGWCPDGYEIIRHRLNDISEMWDVRNIKQ